MAKLPLYIGLESRDIDLAIKALEAMEKRVNQKMDKVCETLAERAVERAQDIYADWDAPDPNPITVWKDKTEDGYSVYATGNPARDAQGVEHGNMVMFAEFGVGTYAGDHPLANEFMAYPGTWSSLYGTGQFYESWEEGDPHWEHNDHLYVEGTLGTNAMYRTGQEMIAHAQNVAKEVFG